MAYWLFQGNPNYYRLIDGIRDFEQMPWMVTRHAKDIAPGDGVLVWVSGKEAGIYAIAEVTESARVLTELPDIGYWKDANRAIGTRHAKIRFTSKFVEKPLLRTDLMKDPVLKNLLVIRTAIGTNFRVTPAEWQRLHELRRKQLWP